MPSKHPLHALCPYFAMFPPEFASAQIARYTRPGDATLDPFSGRGTALLEASLSGRRALASDVNPVAACLTGAKAGVPTLAAAHGRLDELHSEFKSEAPADIEEERKSLPRFFGSAFQYLTLREVLFLRRSLRPQFDDTDRFIAALVLGSLHGEMDRSPSYFSNQMPRTISTKPAYSLRYWKRRNLRPRRRRVFDLLKSRATLRLERGRPRLSGIAVRSDVRTVGRVLAPWAESVRLVVTSPPYLDVTDFEEDQWLRLWFLGGPPHPTRRVHSQDNRHSSPRRYWEFLAAAWKGMEGLLAPNAVIACRIGGKHQTTDSLARGMSATLRGAFPNARMVRAPIATEPLHRQTDNFRPGTRGIGSEVDFVFRV